MQQSSTSQYLRLFLIVMVVLAAAVMTIMRKWSVGNRFNKALSQADGSTASDSDNNPAVLAYYTAGHELLNAGRGTVKDMKYSIYMTGPLSREMGADFVAESAIIYVLDLPFNTQTHLVGLSKKFQLDRLQFGAFLRANGMEKIMLEGDFPDKFDLYASADQGFQPEYVLEPDTMAFIEDYCTHYFWEINNAELYLAVTDNDASATNFMSESGQFVASLQPALLPGQPGAPVVHHDVPYGEYDGPALDCPVCAKSMTINAAYQACPDGQGILLSGGNLAKLNDHELTIPADAAKGGQHGDLICPSCHNPMEQVQFQGGNLQIDSCTNCVFRWLDAGEVAKLSGQPVAAEV